MRLTIRPEELVPKLPAPRDLQPFPSSEALRFDGHTALVRSADFDPSGQYVVSGGDDATVRGEYAGRRAPPCARPPLTASARSVGDRLGPLPAHAAAGRARDARGLDSGRGAEPGGGRGRRAPAATQPRRCRGRAPCGRPHRRTAAGAAAAARRGG